MTETSCSVFVIDPGKVERLAGRIVLPHDVSWGDAYDAARRLYGNVSYIAFSDDDGELARHDPGGEAAVDLYSRRVMPAGHPPMSTVVKEPDSLWRTSPPSVEEVREYPWWWHRAPHGACHVVHLDLSGDIIVVRSDPPPTPRLFNPASYPGEWAVCAPPYKAPT